MDAISCGRCVAKLYGSGRYFLCRHCYGLAYASQSERQWDRTLRRANKLRRQVRGEPGMHVPVPPKPKGMWRRSYDRVLARIVEAEDAAEAAFMAHTFQLLAHLSERARLKR